MPAISKRFAGMARSYKRVTQNGRVKEGGKVKHHTGFYGNTNGQLRFSGSTIKQGA